MAKSACYVKHSNDVELARRSKSSECKWKNEFTSEENPIYIHS